MPKTNIKSIIYFLVLIKTYLKINHINYTFLMELSRMSVKSDPLGDRTHHPRWLYQHT